MKVGILGRTNVGKSTLFNALVGRRRSIMSGLAHTTRDAISATLAGNTTVTMYDLPGWETLRKDDTNSPLIRQMDLFILVTDAHAGLTNSDEDAYKWLKQNSKRFILVINKIDDKKHLQLQYDFARLQADQTFVVSAVHRRNTGELAGYLCDLAGKGAAARSEVVTLAITGRQNTGKSTLMNTLCGFKRTAVSTEKGTTRDYVEHEIKVPCYGRNRILRLVDTAGFFKKKGTKTIVDIIVYNKIAEACKAADVITLLVDCSERIGAFEKRIADIIEGLKKPCIVCVNKTDLLRPPQLAAFKKELKLAFRFISFCPVVEISALRAANIDKLVQKAFELGDMVRKPVEARAIVRKIEEIIASRPPPLIGTRIPKVRKISMRSWNTIVIKLNEEGLLRPPYLRFIENALRDRGYFSEVPVRIIATA